MATTEVQPPVYVTTAEVQRVCAELGIHDWTAVVESTVTGEDAEIIRAQLGGEALDVPTEEFRQGLEVELEHGLRFADANVTNNHPLLTGKIVLAHLKEMLDYYVRLRLAELEGDMFNARIEGDAEKMSSIFSKIVVARRELADSESRRLASVV